MLIPPSLSLTEAIWEASRFLRYDTPYGLPFVVALMHGAPELLFQNTLLEFVDMEFTNKSKPERSDMIRLLKETFEWNGDLPMHITKAVWPSNTLRRGQV